MTKRHLKRLAAPRSWKIGRKAHTWVVRPNPSGHKLEGTIPVLYIIRDLLGYAETFREAKRIINEGKVLIDGKVINDPKRGVGLMDIVEIPLTKERYVVMINKAGTLVLEPIKSTEVKSKLLKITNKTIVKGGKVQLNMHDGRNLLLEPGKAKEHNVDDSIIFDLKSNKIKQHLKYETGAPVFITKGSHRGNVAKIKEINKIRSSMPNVVTLEKDGKEFRTIEEYVLVVGKDKPILSVMK